MLRLTNYVQVKGGIVLIRQNITNFLWNYTRTESVLNETVWIMNATKILEEFESKIVQSIKYRGWDGDEDINKLRWTKIGALFYSIIVITTIGKFLGFHLQFSGLSKSEANRFPWTVHRTNDCKCTPSRFNCHTNDLDHHCVNKKSDEWFLVIFTSLWTNCVILNIFGIGQYLNLRIQRKEPLDSLKI